MTQMIPKHSLIEIEGHKACENCGGSSLSHTLTMHCKGDMLTNKERKQIAAGEIDFRGTRWVDLTQGELLFDIYDGGVIGSSLIDKDGHPWIITGRWETAHGHVMYRFVKTNQDYEPDIEVFSTMYARKVAQVFPYIQELLDNVG